MKHLLSILTLISAMSSTALASGAGTSAPPRPPKAGATAATTMDDAKYALGKAVFSRKFEASDNSSSMAAQKTKLMALAGKSGKEGSALPSLAGKLSAAQLNALEYYVGQRFPQ